MKTMLMIHGFPLCAAMWAQQKMALTAAGYRVLTPDLPGFGTEPARPLPNGLDDYADFLAALLDREGVAQAVVVGMSMGGYILQNLLERYPQRVSAAIFVVTRAATDDEAGKAKRTALAAEARAGRVGPVAEAFSGILFAARTAQERPALVAMVGGWMRSATPEGVAEGLLAMRDRKDYTELLATFTAPALVIGAEQDRAIPAEHSRALAERLPNAELRIVSGAGHLANLEEPEAFNRVLLEFLATLTSSSVDDECQVCTKNTK
ncbi:MAG: alpha/beta hydrolase [Desulfuromonadaceae bacterium]|nr:alpha/beta hydrolase [Desulfuromonadaceae bacterium]